VLGAALLAGPAQTASVSRHLAANMSGLKEVSAKGKKAAGDKNGHGAAVFDFAAGKVCFGITVDGVSTPIAAHIHKAPTGKAGPVVVPLIAPKSGNPGASSGCVAVKPSDATAIQKNPAAYYVNVHTKDFPEGAVRGQLTVLK
jgi:hypothetical protein